VTNESNEKTLEKAVLHLNLLNKFVQQMQEVFNADEPIPDRKVRQLQMIHHKMRGITEEWA